VVAYKVVHICGVIYYTMAHMPSKYTAAATIVPLTRNRRIDAALI
jgi:hypothetical protein